MRWDDLFVGSLAIAIAVASAASAMRWTDLPYQLRSVQAIERRFGDRGTWVFFLLLTALMLVTGAAILSGLRLN